MLKDIIALATTLIDHGNCQLISPNGRWNRRTAILYNDSGRKGLLVLDAGRRSLIRYDAPLNDQCNRILLPLDCIEFHLN